MKTLERAVYDTRKRVMEATAVIDVKALDFLADVAGGDARSALNAVELRSLLRNGAG